MKKIDVGQTISIFANVGILISIVFLAIEVSQNQASIEDANEINRLSARTTASYQASNWRLLLGEHAEIAELWTAGLAGEELSPVDAIRFRAFCADLLWRLATNYERNITLNNEQSARGNVAQAKAQLMENPGLRPCWESEKEVIGLYLASFVDAVENTE